MKKRKKNSNKRTIWIISILAILVIALLGGGFFYCKATKAKEDKQTRSFNKTFEDSYQKITSFQYSYGGSGIFSNQCSLDDETKWEGQINKFDRNSSVSSVDDTTSNFTKCIRGKRVHLFDDENKTISEFSGKIEQLKTKDQKDLAEKLLAKSRDYVTAKQEYNQIWDDYYDKQISWAYAIQSYAKGEISLAERNSAVDDLNKSFDSKTSKVQTANNKIDNIQAERNDIYARLMSILPR